MKNKEIEELLKNIKEQIITDEKLGKEIAQDFHKTTLNYKETKLLLSYIVQLEKENKKLQNIVDEPIQIPNFLFDMSQELKIDKLEQHCKQLENNRDKALKKLNKYRNRKDHYGLWCMEYIDNADIIHILKGDSDE